ncbi:tumor necrosis factor receptor superfamily member 16 isoform X2 [Phyllopteryx taeniolatus]|uniref:tumor necrosis factor receptor superfamily member 16 isoform X2 n=1 Tax=Phyllopteryx taeniolatus TaxID=161469 RepID=UPI002AD56012|nr:tumor necrosis factor receptor superfamily member 16 isoform X2 [Phyllopteryx taeniolatus]
MAPLLICGFILLKVVFGDACASGQFTESGECCRVCPAGFGVAVECGKDDTKCTPCPQGTFSSSEDLGRCLPCSQCPYGVPTLATCSAVEDTQCECDSGFFYFRAYGLCAPCSKCKRGEGAAQECGPKGDTQCRLCVPGTFSEEHANTKPCQTCTQCTDSEVEIRACMPNSDTLCMDKKLHILSRDTPSWSGVEEVTAGGGSPAPGTPKFTPQGEKGGNNILAYVSVLAAVVLGLLVYVAYKWWVLISAGVRVNRSRLCPRRGRPSWERLRRERSSKVTAEFSSTRRVCKTISPAKVQRGTASRTPAYTSTCRPTDRKKWSVSCRKERGVAGGSWARRWGTRPNSWTCLGAARPPRARSSPTGP